MHVYSQQILLLNIHKHIHTHLHEMQIHTLSYTHRRTHRDVYSHKWPNKHTTAHSYMKSNPNWDNTEVNEKPFPVCLIGLSHGAGLIGWHIHQRLPVSPQVISNCSRLARDWHVELISPNQSLLYAFITSPGWNDCCGALVFVRGGSSEKDGTKETQVQQIQMKMKLAVLLNERLIVSDYIFHCRL